MMDIVPKSLTRELLDFCAEISPETPLFVPSIPCFDAQVSNCFDNAARKVWRDGGASAFGWAIWNVPNLSFEAEHHGIWQSAQGELIDVSPQINNAPTILFLPDPNAVYDSTRFRQSIIKPATNQKDSLVFSALSNELSLITNKYRQGGMMSEPSAFNDIKRKNEINERLSEIIARNRLENQWV